jgi:hypothetical protein
MLSFSAQLSSVQWDSDFPVEAEAVFYRDVEPAVLEMEEELQSNRFLRELTVRIVGREVLVPPGSGLALALSPVHVLPTVVSAAIGISLGSAYLAGASYAAREAKASAAKHHQLYLYYRLGQSLKERRK